MGSGLSHSPLNRKTLAEAIDQLSSCEILGPVVEAYEAPKLARAVDPFAKVVASIVGQQLSTKAAATIHKRLLGLFDEGELAPVAMLALSPEELREVGISKQKAGYLHDLSQKLIDGTVRPEEFPQLSNEEISSQLIQIKGIGQWSADMYLIFALNRTDVWPIGDLGIQNGVQALLGRKKKLTPLAMQRAGNRWKPYRSVAARYVWSSLDNTPD